uniref:FA complementation group L n=2 Tax=Macaca fascicularis TaxID=9541 RepID=A0A7N9IB26_MACFA
MTLVSQSCGLERNLPSHYRLGSPDVASGRAPFGLACALPSFPPAESSRIFPPRLGFPLRGVQAQADCACAGPSRSRASLCLSGLRAMAVTEASLLRQCPLLLPQNRSKTVYEGFISAQSSLISIYSQFLAAIESLKAFWDVMDEIDEKTWVLEPEKPPRSATARRIALGNNVSINIEVDPRHPTMLPECFFLGADHVVKPLGIKLSRNIHLWDPENSVLQNLKDVLEIDFPARAILEKSDFTMDCGICYAYQLDGAIPDQVCDNSQCGQPFHQICLYEWLRGLLTSRQSFNIIFGECPYCSKPITLKMSGRKH